MTPVQFQETMKTINFAALQAFERFPGTLRPLKYSQPSEEHSRETESRKKLFCHNIFFDCYDQLRRY